MERVRSKNLYTNSFTRNKLWNFRLMFLKTLALIYGFLLYFNPVKALPIELPMFIITTLFPLRLFCGKSFCLMIFCILNQILWGILFGSSLRVNRDKSTVIEMVQDIESFGQRDWFMSYLLSLRAWNYYVINISDLFIQLLCKLESGLHKSISWWLRLPHVFSD